MVFSGCSDLWVLSRLTYAEKKAAEPAAGAAAAEDAPAAGDATASGNAPADAVNAPAAPVAAAPEPDAPANAANEAAAPADVTPAPAAPAGIANEPAAPADSAATDTEPHAEDSGNVTPGLVWDDEGTDAGQAEVPENMRQEEQTGGNKDPKEDA